MVQMERVRLDDADGHNSRNGNKTILFVFVTTSREQRRITSNNSEYF